MQDARIAQLTSSSSKHQEKPSSQPDCNATESINAITLKSGKVLKEPQPKEKVQMPLPECNKEAINTKEKEVEKSKAKDKGPPPYVPPLPFPQRLKKTKEDIQFKRFLEILGKLDVTLPFTEVLTQVPSYAKFLKEIISRKREVNNLDHVTLDANCSAIIQHAMPRKLSDQGSFTIPISIGNIHVRNALCDLGASISLMPYSLFKKLGLRDLTPTSTKLRLADRSFRLPKGILEDIPIKIGKFYVPVDFHVLEMDEKCEIPIILGRPFLNTVKALIDCGDGTIELNLGCDKIKFHMKKTFNAPSSSTDCHLVDAYDSYDEMNALCELTNFGEELLEQKDNFQSFTPLMELVEGDASSDDAKLEVELKGKEFGKGLKPPPPDQRYELHGLNKLFSNFIETPFDGYETSKFMHVLEICQDFIDNFIDDSKGINLEFCMQEFDLVRKAKNVSHCDELTSFDSKIFEDDIVMKSLAFMSDVDWGINSEEHKNLAHKVEASIKKKRQKRSRTKKGVDKLSTQRYLSRKRGDSSRSPFKDEKKY